MSKLEEMLKYVSEHNDFYKKIIREHGITDPTDITQYPILTRQTLQENRYNMFSDGYAIDYFAEKLVRLSSSGSCGLPVNVYYDRDQYNSMVLSIWRLRNKYHHITPINKKLLISYSADERSKNIYLNQENILIIHIKNSFSDQEKIAVLDAVEKYKPEWIYACPSLLRTMCRFYRSFHKNPPESIRYIETTGEVLDEITIREVQDVFGIRVTNMYGTEEVGAIAYECPFGNMHILNDNVYLESKENSGDEISSDCSVIITNLNNYTMPIIKYDIGDRIKIDNLKNKCKCGGYGKIISYVYGRSSEHFICNSCEINSNILSKCVHYVNNILSDPITEYKFNYNTLHNKLTCYFDIGSSFIVYKSEIKKLFVASLEAFIGSNSDVCFDFVYGSLCHERKHKVLEVF